MAGNDVNYRKEAEDDAKSMALEFLDQIVEQLEEKGKASDDLNNDYAGADSYHHETNVDRSYSLIEAAHILDDLDEIVDQILNKGKASDRFDRYPHGDSYHHSTHIDRSYDLMEADHLLDELSRVEETDGGIWEGLDPREAVKTQAAYTYGNAVRSAWETLIENVNNEAEQILPRRGPKDWSPKNRLPASKDFAETIGDFIRSER